jgi:multiple inositol-polyphosphate phosphatase/2,3-bisphosphoglycerate 3-phosphatase
MKKALLFTLFISGFAFIASAQNCNDSFLGTKTLYKATSNKYTPPPAGYSAVFINHVGRHGARHLTKDVSTTLAYTLLLQADSANALTDKGKQLEQMVIALQKIEKGNTKSISAEGVHELKGLGERLYVNYPGVFKGRPNITVAVTKEIRTKQSADAFLQGLNSKLKDSATVSFYNDDTGLRFYDLSPVYKAFEGRVDSGAFKSALKKAEHINEANKTITARFFTADFLKGTDEEQQAKFVSDIFGFVTIVYSLNKEVQQAGFSAAELNFKTFFTCAELEKLGELDNADDYLKKGPGTNNDGIQVRIAVPLLVNFIKTSDEFITTGRYNACLRFAHAETIAPFAALLQIAAADKATTVVSKFSNNWQASAVIPLSSNIQWVFYKRKNRTGYLVKVLLNEKEAHISGLKGIFPYYKWADMRAFYMNRLNKLHVHITDDMNTYLANVK